MKMLDIGKKMKKIAAMNAEDAEFTIKMDIILELTKFTTSYSVLTDPKKIGETMMRMGMFIMTECNMDHDRIMEIIDLGIYELIENEGWQ